MQERLAAAGLCHKLTGSTPGVALAIPRDGVDCDLIRQLLNGGRTKGWRDQLRQFQSASSSARLPAPMGQPNQPAAGSSPRRPPAPSRLRPDHARSWVRRISACGCMMAPTRRDNSRCLSSRACWRNRCATLYRPSGTINRFLSSISFLNRAFTPRPSRIGDGRMPWRRNSGTVPRSWWTSGTTRSAPNIEQIVANLQTSASWEDSISTTRNMRMTILPPVP